jgi:hypothetical protein
MKRIFALILVLTATAVSPAFAAPWTAAVTADINNGNYAGINQVVAANPSAAGDIAAFVLQQAQNDAGSNPGKSVKLLEVAVPLAAQIPGADKGAVLGNVQALLNLANNTNFQNSNPKGTAKVFAGLINILSLPNFSGNPKLQGQVVADASAFIQSHPGADDELKDDVLLAMGFDLNGVNPDMLTIRRRTFRDLPGEGPPAGPNITPPSPE